MNQKISMKRRNSKSLPPEKLYAILRIIYPKNTADLAFVIITGHEPPKENT